MFVTTCFKCGRIIFGYPCLWCDWGDEVEYYGIASRTFIKIDVTKEV